MSLFLFMIYFLLFEIHGSELKVLLFPIIALVIMLTRLAFGLVNPVPHHNVMQNVTRTAT